jgi:hypothetical protein
MRDEFIESMTGTQVKANRKVCLKCGQSIKPGEEACVSNCTFCLDCGLCVFSLNPIKQPDGIWISPWIHMPKGRPKYEDPEWIKRNAHGPDGELIIGEGR